MSAAPPGFRYPRAGIGAIGDTVTLGAWGVAVTYGDLWGVHIYVTNNTDVGGNVDYACVRIMVSVCAIGPFGTYNYDCKTGSQSSITRTPTTHRHRPTHQNLKFSSISNTRYYGVEALRPESRIREEAQRAEESDDGQRAGGYESGDDHRSSTIIERQ